MDKDAENVRRKNDRHGPAVAVPAGGRGAAMREPAVREALQAAEQVPPEPALLRMRRMQPLLTPPAAVEIQAPPPA